MGQNLSNAALLKRLVGFDSVSRNSNLPIADFICDYLDRPNIRIDRNEAVDKDKTNLAIAMGPVDNPGRKGLVLSGHMDVVPADETDWESDPFQLKEANDTYIGRGAADMKGFLALAANTMTTLDADELTHPLVLILTYDEEIGTVGAKRFVETWANPEMLPRSAIIGEPTSLRVIRMHKGHIGIRITVEGAPAHSGYPHLGVNAIEPVGDLIAALTKLRRQLEKETPKHREYFPEVPFVPLNIAQVTGGVATNVVPDACELLLGFRILPGMDSESVLAPIRESAEQALRGFEHSVTVTNESPPLLVDDGAPVYRAACRHVSQSETFSASYATDAGWLQTLGIDCVIWGPGSIEVAHKPNEALPRDELERSADLVDKMVQQHCVND